MAIKARMFWLGCVGTLLVASCVTSPASTTPDGKEVTRRTTPTGAKRSTPRPTTAPGEDGGTGATEDPNATTAVGVATPTPTPTATATAAVEQEAFFAKVVDAAGQKVVGADISGFPGDATGFVAAAKTAKSDANGHFEMKAADSKPMNVLVTTTDGKKAFKPNIAADSSNNTFTLRDPGTIKGQVTAVGLSDLSNIEVVIPGTDFKATTDASGNYTLSGVPVGTHGLKATRGGVGTGNRSDVVVTAGQETTGANIAISTSVPNITTLSPLNGGKGVEVTINGTNFGTDPSKVQVTFAGEPATVTSVSATQIKTTVPDVQAAGAVVVKVNNVASNSKAFQVIQYIYFKVERTALYVGDTFTYEVEARDWDDAAIASPTITSWEATGTAFSVTPATNKLSAVVEATGGGSGYLRVLSGTEEEQIELTVDPTAIAVSTVAGNGTTGDTASTLLGPTGIAGMADGSAFYICDQNESLPGTKGSRIRKLTSGGTLSSYAGATTHAFVDDADPAVARFHFPRNALMDGDTLYVSDMFNNRIRQIDTTTGAVTTAAGVTQTFNFGAGDLPTSSDAENKLCFPAGLAMDAAKTIYFTEWHYTSGASKIRMLASDGTLGTIPLSGTGDGKLNNPTGLVVTSDGSTIYVADTGNNLIKRINATTGAVTKVIGVKDANGIGLPGYRDGDETIAQIQGPDGLAMDSAGRLYCTDGLGYIREITIDDVGVAQVKTLAGTGAPAEGGGEWHQDGAGSEAKFQQPFGIWVKADGSELYVADYLNKRIRKVTITRP